MDKDSLLKMDSNILLSIINMKLRDFYSSLESLCQDIDVKEEELKEKLSSIGYEYKKDQNQFK